MPAGLAALSAGPIDANAYSLLGGWRRSKVFSGAVDRLAQISNEHYKIAKSKLPYIVQTNHAQRTKFTPLVLSNDGSII